MKSYLIECAEINYFTIEVDAQSEDEARELADDERCGPTTAWDAPFCTQDDIYSVEEEDIEEEVEV